MLNYFDRLGDCHRGRRGKYQPPLEFDRASEKVSVLGSIKKPLDTLIELYYPKGNPESFRDEPLLRKNELAERINENMLRHGIYKRRKSPHRSGRIYSGQVGLVVLTVDQKDLPVRKSGFRQALVREFDDELDKPDFCMSLLYQN